MWSSIQKGRGNSVWEWESPGRWYLSEDQAVARAGWSPSGIAAGRWRPPLAFLPLDTRHHPVLSSLPRIITEFCLPPASTRPTTIPYWHFHIGALGLQFVLYLCPSPRRGERRGKGPVPQRRTQAVIPHVGKETQMLDGHTLPSTLHGAL